MLDYVQPVSPDRRAGFWHVSALTLVGGGVLLTLLGAVLLFSGVFPAMGPEDEVPVLGWLIPLGIGIASVVTGRRLAGSLTRPPNTGSGTTP